MQRRWKSESAAAAESGLPLYRQSEVPLWLREPHILSHYRAGYSLRQCVRSLFSIHNQTGNVWTHLLGLLIVLFAARYVYGDLLHDVFVHRLVFAVLLSGFALCMLSSTLFHLFSCHMNEAVHRRFLALDYTGITACIIGSFYPPTYLAFSCVPMYRWVYLSIITVLGAVGLLGPRFAFFNAPEFQTQRVALYIAMAVFGLIPTYHVTLVLPLNPTTIPFIGGVLLMLGLYALGLLFFLSRFPESCFPGQFDLLFQSHQLWHLFVLCAAIVHLFTTIGMYKQWSGDLEQMLSLAQC